MPNQEKYKYALLPVYLVLDTSVSMEDDRKFELALEFIPKLLDSLEDSSSLSDKIRVEVITFDKEARLELALGGLKEVGEWYARIKASPIIPDGDYTYYGKAFEMLSERIQKGVQQIRSDEVHGVPNARYQAHRPVAFFITDGEPNDDTNYRDNQYAKLTDEKFEYRPNLICVGVGDAKRDILNKYGAGRYGQSRYITGNNKLVIVPRDGVLKKPSEVLPDIIDALINSIMVSFNDAEDIGDGFDLFGTGEAELFGEQESLTTENNDWEVIGNDE